MQPISFRLAIDTDLPALEEMIIASFEPITWYRKVEEAFGNLNGHGWLDRWHLRMQRIFDEQIIFVGEVDGMIVAAATGTADPMTKLGYVELLAVGREHQGKGYGKAMLNAMLDHFRARGMEHATLDSLISNETANALYRNEGWTCMASSYHWMRKL